ncbi:MAG: pilin, partial [Pseudomonadota bacterium]
SALDRPVRRRWLSADVGLYGLAMLACVLLGLNAHADDRPKTAVLKEQVLEAYYVSAVARLAISERWSGTRRFAADREAAGMSREPTDTRFGPVASLHIFHGVVVVVFGDKADDALVGKALVIMPIVTERSKISWRCASAPPAELADLATVPAAYYPDACQT